MLKKMLLKIAGYIPFYREILLILRGLDHIQTDLAAARFMESARIFTFEMENNPRYKDPLRLQRYTFQVNSQNGEDGILLEIFRRIGTQNRILQKWAWGMELKTIQLFSSPKDGQGTGSMAMMLFFRRLKIDKICKMIA